MVSRQDVVSEGSQSMFGNPSQWQAPLAGRMQPRMQTSLWVKFDLLREQDVTLVTLRSHELRPVTGGLRKYLRTEHSEPVLFRAQHGGKREVTKHKDPRRHCPFPTTKKKKTLHSQLHKSNTGKGCPRLH